MSHIPYPPPPSPTSLEIGQVHVEYTGTIGKQPHARKNNWPVVYVSLTLISGHTNSTYTYSSTFGQITLFFFFYFLFSACTLTVQSNESNVPLAAATFLTPAQPKIRNENCHRQHARRLALKTRKKNNCKKGRANTTYSLRHLLCHFLDLLQLFGLFLVDGVKNVEVSIPHMTNDRTCQVTMQHHT